MKNFLLFLGNIILIWNIFTSVSAGNIDFWDASSATNQIKNVSISASEWSTEDQIESISFNVFKTIKIVLWWLLVIYMVYAWVMMIFSMWDDDSQLSNAKRSLWHSLVWLLFINIPGSLYDAFSNKRTVDDVTASTWDTLTIFQRNIFMNSQMFWSTLWWILIFLEIAIVALAIFMIILEWIKMILSWGEEDKMTEGKNKILWSLVWLIFIGVMEVWRNFIFKADFQEQGQDLFSTLINIALFFAGPVGIFFLSLAWYYYITDGWDWEKAKKAKTIVINTAFATLILLGMYTFLIDLKDLSF